MIDNKRMLSDEYRKIIEEDHELITVVESRAQPGLYIPCPDCFGTDKIDCWNCNGHRKLFVIPDDCITVKHCMALQLVWLVDEKSTRAAAERLKDQW